MAFCVTQIKYENRTTVISAGQFSRSTDNFFLYDLFSAIFQGSLLNTL